MRPRIEPEIIFGLVKSPSLDMSDSDLWKCIGWISHGFEIVESVFPGWSFTPADAVAVGGLHAELYIGRKTWTNGWPDPNKPSPADANTSDLAEPNMFVPPTAGDSDSQGHLDRQRSWEKMLEQFQIELRHNDRLVAEGCGSDVLGSPLTALRHLVELVARSPFNPRLAAGEIVTTGTVTEALPIKSGESWSTRLKDIDLANATLLLRKDA
ncbi:hypothetical protein H2203_003257 [Taxawa tesnikishii (nom. ined.)]|nr:hypothetical protein H2203_003257 [Dothideales sp. JES 119]